MSELIHNCTTCFIKRYDLKKRCPVYTVEYWGDDHCDAWIKDINDFNKREDACEKYEADHNPNYMRRSYTCPYCKNKFLDIKQSRHICTHCGRMYISSRERDRRPKNEKNIT